jgi:hypothetical protein
MLGGDFNFSFAADNAPKRVSIVRVLCIAHTDLYLAYFAAIGVNISTFHFLSKIRVSCTGPRPQNRYIYTGKQYGKIPEEKFENKIIPPQNFLVGWIAKA